LNDVDAEINDLEAFINSLAVSEVRVVEVEDVVDANSAEALNEALDGNEAVHWLRYFLNNNEV
jgi:hypothetical protein